jgi:hypothetical protein
MGLTILINRKDFSLISFQNGSDNGNEDYLDAVAKTYFKAIEHKKSKKRDL